MNQYQPHTTESAARDMIELGLDGGWRHTVIGHDAVKVGKARRLEAHGMVFLEEDGANGVVATRTLAGGWALLESRKGARFVEYAEADRG